MTVLIEDNSIHQPFETLKNAFLHHGEIPPRKRRERLVVLLACIKKSENEIIESLNKDFGNRSGYETRLNEIFPLILAIKQAIKEVFQWAKPRPQKTSWLFKPSTAYLLPQAKGVVGIISPWNYPLLLALSPLTQAITAGNRVMLKPSSRTQHTADVIRRICKTVFDNDEVYVCMPNDRQSREFATLPFDHLIFTGSGKTGKVVMTQAAKNLTPVTLELGGKNPALLTSNYPVEKAAQSIAKGKMLNAGQACIAPDYVCIPKDTEDRFVKFYIESIQRFYPKQLTDPDFTAVRDIKDIERLDRYLDDAKLKGAKVIYPFKPLKKVDGTYVRYPPCIVTNCSEDMQLMQEEIFGPILPIITYSGLENCLNLMRMQDKSLVMYLFSNSNEEKSIVQDRTHSGALCINETLLHFAQENLPFGGIGQSGMGAYHGKTGFDTLSHLKPVYQHSRFNSTKAHYPPFKPSLIKLLNMAERFS